MSEISWERESERLWEEMTMPTDGAILRNAAKALNFACYELDNACESLQEGCELLSDTPEGDKVKSLLDELETVLKDVKRMRKEWGQAE